MWYTGITLALTNTSLTNKFQRTHGSPLDFQINYDDGQSHVYKQKDKEIFDMIVDQDTKQDYQRIAWAIPENIGGAGAYVRLNDGTTVELSKALGAVGSSFTPEVRAAHLGFEHICSMTDTNIVLWITDSRSTLDALKGNIWKTDEEIQILWNMIYRFLERGIRVIGIWTPSHLQFLIYPRHTTPLTAKYYSENVPINYIQTQWL